MGADDGAGAAPVVNEYPGGYDDWLAQSKSQAKATMKIPVTKAKEGKAATEKFVPAEKAPTRRKLSYQEEKELAALPAKIERLESRQDELYTLMADPAFFKGNPVDIKQSKDELEKIEDELAMLKETIDYLEKLLKDVENG